MKPVFVCNHTASKRWAKCGAHPPALRKAAQVIVLVPVVATPTGWLGLEKNWEPFKKIN